MTKSNSNSPGKPGGATRKRGRRTKVSKTSDRSRAAAASVTPVKKKRATTRKTAAAKAAAPAVPYALLEAQAKAAADSAAAERRWGPDNPHPLSKMKTELVWEGKYDEWGQRREVDIAGCAMPMQRIETIDQPRSEAAAAGQLELFEKKTTRLNDFRNRLIWGDNKLVMASLLAEFKGKIDLIYIDPPYDVGADFTCDVLVGDEENQLQKQQSTLEMVAYQDTWGRGVDSYLQMMADRLVMMRDLLSERGSIFLHCDWHVGHLIRAILDDVFGSATFLNEIIWYYYNKLHDSRKKILPRAHDLIFRYAKHAGGGHIHCPLKEQREKPVTKLKYRKVDGQIQNIIGDDGKAVTYVSTDKTVDDVWRLRCLQPANKAEYTRFRTQKPLDLIQRIIGLASTNDSIVFDAFCGTGTTLVAAELCGRRWIGCDLGRFAIHTARKRLLDSQRGLHAEDKPYRAFDVYNLGRYERQWWQQEALKGADAEHRRVVLEFFRAEVLDPARVTNPLIHGRKGAALCHVDGIDSIFTSGEARAVADAAAGMGAKEVYCLAWDFEMDIRQRMAAIAAATGVKLVPVKIPREIMEKNRKGPPPWLEVAVLEAEPVYTKKDGETQVDIKLTKFLPSLAEINSKELEAIKERAIKSGFDFIDFWAIDFEWHSDKPFNHHWQDYRTRKDRSLKTKSEAGFAYARKGSYTACVKVVDVFGSDTSISVNIKV